MCVVTVGLGWCSVIDREEYVIFTILLVCRVRYVLWTWLVFLDVWPWAVFFNVWLWLVCLVVWPWVVFLDVWLWLVFLDVWPWLVFLDVWPWVVFLEGLPRWGFLVCCCWGGFLVCLRGWRFLFRSAVMVAVYVLTARVFCVVLAWCCFLVFVCRCRLATHARLDK